MDFRFYGQLIRTMIERTEIMVCIGKLVIATSFGVHCCLFCDEHWDMKMMRIGILHFSIIGPELVFRIGYEKTFEAFRTGASLNPACKFQGELYPINLKEKHLQKWGSGAKFCTFVK